MIPASFIKRFNDRRKQFLLACLNVLKQQLKKLDREIEELDQKLNKDCDCNFCRRMRNRL